MIMAIVEWARGLGGHKRARNRDRVLRRKELVRLTMLGIHPERLAGRLRLVLTAGCYRDFRFTCDILLTSAMPEQHGLAIEALIELGAHCDCEVFRALGQLPMGVLWHNDKLPSERVS